VHVAELHAVGFRRFADLTIRIPTSPKLVVVCGPNGNGKSSLFDAFRTWQGWLDGRGTAQPHYLLRPDAPQAHPWQNQVTLVFHDVADVQSLSDAAKKAIYMRSAYRNDPEFSSSTISRPGGLLDSATTRRTIDNDVRVSENYARMAGQTFVDLYSGANDAVPAGELRERYVGQLRDAILRVFPDLELLGPGDPLEAGTFEFRKGAVEHFPYLNLSGGEKAVFDLLLDLLIKSQAYDDTIICIDEPEAHLNTRVQGRVLRELLGLVNAQSQLWIASHSIGMMRAAQELSESNAGDVVFLDFEGQDFDAPTLIEPIELDRAFFQRTLDVALGDLAPLVAPSRVVLCEGKPLGAQQTRRAEFDARCYRAIFGDPMPDTDFLSVGNSSAVEEDELGIGSAMTALLPGTTVIRVVDRDLRTAPEIQALQDSGVRVLSRRHLESFLLDDEVLAALCDSVGEPGRVADVLAIKEAAVQASVGRGKDPDDMKSAAAEIYRDVRQLLGLAQPGNNTGSFLSDILAPLLKPGMAAYEQLRADIFG